MIRSLKRPSSESDCGGSGRVLSRIYRLGEKSRVVKATSFLGWSRGMPPPQNFWNEYVLRCNLVHFETQFWEVLQCVQWPAVTIWLLNTVVTTILIFLGGSWAFWGGSFYPSNTLDRTLVVGRVFLGIPVGGLSPCSPKTRENELILSCQILTLFQAKTCHFPHPFSHAASESCTLFFKPLLCSS